VPFIVRWPGHVVPGRTSNEIVSMIDMYRTFANVAGASDEVPTDRPIDSIDQTEFLFGNQEKSNRESVIFFYGAELLSVKWRNYKVHFSVRQTSTGDVRNPGQQMITSEVIKPGYPWMFDIENDPKEMTHPPRCRRWMITIEVKRSGSRARDPQRSNACFWHIADMERCPTDVRFWG
jgi:arylsulfatase A-like enzyme